MPNNLLNGDFIETVVWCQQGPQAGLSVVHHFVTSVVGVISDQDVANYWINTVSVTGLGPIMAPLLTLNASFLGVTVQNIFPVRRPIVQSKPAAPVAGTAGPDALPLQCSGLIRKIGNVANRHGRGRIYIPFPDRASSAADANLYPSPNGLYELNALSYGGAVATTQVPTLPGASCTLVPMILNRLVPLASAQVDNLKVMPLWATQRRRSESGRPNVSPF